MKRLLFMFLAVSALSFSVACSSDDDNAPDVETADLVGTWQLKSIDFTVFEDSGFPASDPCILELVAGYDFKADHSFYFVLGEGGFFDPYEREYWTWSGDTESFKITQTNPSMPPYNFGIEPTNIEIVKVDGQWKMTFHAELSNGSAGNFMLVKQELDLEDLPVLRKPDGSVYECGFFDPFN